MTAAKAAAGLVTSGGVYWLFAEETDQDLPPVAKAQEPQAASGCPVATGTGLCDTVAGSVPPVPPLPTGFSSRGAWRIEARASSERTAWLDEGTGQMGDLFAH